MCSNVLNWCSEALFRRCHFFFLQPAAGLTNRVPVRDSRAGTLLPEILLRAIDLQINAVKSCTVIHCGLALSKVRRMPTWYWRSFGISADYVMSFRWVFRITDQAVLVYWLRHTKINTQLHTKVKVEEIFKVIYLSSSYEYFFRFLAFCPWSQAVTASIYTSPTNNAPQVKTQSPQEVQSVTLELRLVV